jgi:putative heme-binding domain-containing protein
MIPRAALLVLSAAALSGQSSTDEIQSGRQLFLEACSACHGQNGGGGQGPSLIDSRRVRDMNNDRMLDVIQNGLKGTAMPASPLAKAQIQSIVAFVSELSAPAIDAHAPGDPAAGKALYLGKGGCVRCHSIAGEGGWLGPDLTDAGALRTIAQIRESIADPDRRITPDYQAATVRTRGGELIEGIVRNYDNYSVQMIDATGKPHLIRRANLERFDLLEHSLMPRDYGNRLTPAEMDDLVAWLSRQSIRPREKP